jgi:Cys-rich protein (TIGR01571 family)
MDEEDEKVQTVILKPDPTHRDTLQLKKTLSRSYPHMGFNEALQKENEKLQVELQRSQACYDPNQCKVIQHLIDVTEVAANAIPCKDSPKKAPKTLEHNNSDVNEKEHSYDEGYTTKTTSRNISSVSSGQDLLSHKGSFQHEEWHTDLLDCCSKPSLCLKTLFFPCGTFSRIATVANNRPISSSEACNDLMAYSLILSCCCYTCCVRRRLRKMLNITGGFVDDFLSHLMCCCCALVQEWREVEIRGIYGSEKTKTSPPPSQFMES